MGPEDCQCISSRPIWNGSGREKDYRLRSEKKSNQKGNYFYIKTEISFDRYKNLIKR